MYDYEDTDIYLAKIINERRDDRLLAEKRGDGFVVRQIKVNGETVYPEVKHE